MLHYWIETLPQQVLQSRLDDPLFIRGRFAITEVKKFMQSVAELEVVTRPCRPRRQNIVVILHHIVVSQFNNRQ